MLARATGPSAAGAVASANLQGVFLLNGALYGLAALGLLLWLRGERVSASVRQSAVTAQRLVKSGE
jgi:hypothetical protein